jgi:LysR family hydrogen peroxide-inducible transcriptional activator
MISLKQLRYFEAVARTRHFGKAAEQCAVTQPALSMQIQELEKTLGVQLLERSRNGIMLTEAGRDIAGRANRILADTRDIVDFARRQGSVLSGPLHLGVIPSVAPYVLPALLPLIREKFPDLDLHLRETQTHHLVQELLDGGLDLLLLALPVENPEVETIKLFNDRFLLAMPKSRQVSNRIRATPELLQQDRLLLLEEGHCLRDQALSYCSLRRVDNIDTFGASNLSTIVPDGRWRPRHDAAAGIEHPSRMPPGRYQIDALHRPAATPRRRPRPAAKLAAQAALRRTRQADCAGDVGADAEFGIGVSARDESVGWAKRSVPTKQSGIRCIEVLVGTAQERLCPPYGIVIASAAKQSRSRKRRLDCFVAALLAMTAGVTRRAPRFSGNYTP